MKILKQVEGSKIVLYSFETDAEMMSNVKRPFLRHVLFSGTKSELEKKDDSFWEPLVEKRELSFTEGFIYKPSQSIWWADTPSESGRSAISDLKGEFVLITQENI